jgi:hypothetical protein
VASKGVVETGKLAHEIVEAAAGGGHFAQRKGGERARRARPQKQREMCARSPRAANVSIVVIGNEKDARRRSAIGRLSFSPARTGR